MILLNEHKTKLKIQIITPVNLWILKIGLCLLLVINLFLLWYPPVNKINYVSEKVQSWKSNYSDLTEPSTQLIAFQKLYAIILNDDKVTQELYNLLLSKSPEHRREYLSVIAGVLSSQGSSNAQQVLCRILQLFQNDDQEALTVMPQIMLLENPQPLLFDQILHFIHKTPSKALKENGELMLAGLWKNANINNSILAKKIEQWLVQKKSKISSQHQDSLAHFLDLLGNSANPKFLPDILQRLSHQNPAVRERAVFALRLFQNKLAFDALTKQLAIESDIPVKNKGILALNYLNAEFGK